MAKQPKDEKNASDFMKLYQNDFTDSIMEKGTQKISYIPWASAWAEVKKVFPDASFEKHLFDVRDPKGECPMYQVPYLKDKQGYCYVVVTVTINGQSITDTFPVTDYKNTCIKNPDASAVYNSQQRALAKVLAFHGFGLRLYTGEEFEGLTDEDFDWDTPPKKKLEPAPNKDEQVKNNPKPKEGPTPEPVDDDGEDGETPKSVTREQILEFHSDQISEDGQITMEEKDADEKGVAMVAAIIHAFMPRISDKDGAAPEEGFSGEDRYETGQHCAHAVAQFYKRNQATMEMLKEKSPKQFEAIKKDFMDAKSAAKANEYYPYIKPEEKISE